MGEAAVIQEVHQQVKETTPQTTAMTEARLARDGAERAAVPACSRPAAVGRRSRSPSEIRADTAATERPVPDRWRAKHMRRPQGHGGG